MTPHVLIVDDESHPLESLRDILQEMNRLWRISTATTVEEAECIIRQSDSLRGPVDVVLTDVVMHDDHTAGARVLEAAHKADPFLMVILFTAKEKSLNRFEALATGAFDVIEKSKFGAEAWREISMKASSAAHFREVALQKLRQERDVASLRRFFDPRIFSALLEEPHLLGLRLRTTTVGFFDIRGFTAFCESLRSKPQLMEKFLRKYYETAATVVLWHAGILDKFLGDGVMALFCGLEDRNDGGEVDALNAVRSAFVLQESFADLVASESKEWRREVASVIEIGLGCGIHTGEPFVGSLGIEQRDEFTAIGPAVNFAARLQGRARAGEILVSQTTAERVKRKYSLEPAGLLEDVKGVPGKHPIFKVLSEVE